MSRNKKYMNYKGEWGRLKISVDTSRSCKISIARKWSC